MTFHPSLSMGSMRPNELMMPPSGFYNPSTTYSQFNPISSGSSIALFNLPSDATNSLYIDGVPNDTNQREVSHIFRPFPGYECIRLIRKIANNNREYFLCFVDFENSLQASIAMNTLQGYRFDKYDKVGLKISFANESRQSTKDKKKKRDRDR